MTQWLYNSMKTENRQLLISKDTIIACHMERQLQLSNHCTPNTLKNNFVVN